MQWNLLVIEDDKALSDGIRLALQDAQHRIVQAETLHAGKCCLEKMIETSGRGEQERIDLVILDLNLPDGNGLELLQWIRERLALPVIILTANDLEIDIVTGLESGADDYITKPFNPLELVARVKSQLRRYTQLGNMNNQMGNHVFKCGGLQINDENKEVTVDGELIKLTPIEYNILLLLVKNAGKVFSIDQIYEAIWNEEAIGADNTVAVHIRHIREKIEINPREPRYLKVVWGVGYKIEKQ